MKEIPLTQGYAALVDDADFERASLLKWCADVRRYPDGTVRKIYAIHAMPRGNGARKCLLLHRFIMEPDTAQHIDHINGDGLDNRRSNMRACTRTENLRNSRKKKNASSKFKGVYWNKTAGKWQAGIDVGEGKYKYLGLFLDEVEASRAYDSAAVLYFGDFARTNHCVPAAS